MDCPVTAEVAGSSPVTPANFPIMTTCDIRCHKMTFTNVYRHLQPVLKCSLSVPPHDRVVHSESFNRVYGASDLTAVNIPVWRCLLTLACLLLDSPHARADYFYVSSFANNNITRFDSSGNYSVFADTDLNGPCGLAFDNSGNLYAANQNNDTIVKFDPNGNVTVFATAASGLVAPHYLAFDTNGNLYVSNIGTGTILKFDQEGNVTVFASGLDAPQNVAFDGNGNLYVSNWDGNILKFDASGNATVFGSVFSGYPDGLAFDASGNLYVVNYFYGYNRPGSVFKFAPNGTRSVFATSLDLQYATDLAFDSSGELYVLSTYNERIEKFDSTGNGALFATYGVWTPEGIAVQVPEPATISLAGTTLIVAAAHAFRRRSQRPTHH